MSGLVEFTAFQDKVVLAPSVQATSLILLTVQSTNGVGAPSAAVVSRVPGTSFTIRSGHSTDTVTVGWVILD